MLSEKQKLRLSYGTGGICDNALYTLTGTYLLIYLTTVAGVSPAIAGTISAIGSVWEAVVGPIIGFRSDKTLSRFGKRKPFMLAAAIPIMIVTGLLFSSFEMGQTAKSIYYGVMIILFWTFFSMEFIPYVSWGADLTDDYHERTVLRSYAYVFNQVGMFIGMVLPALIVDISMETGFSKSGAWQAAGIFCGVSAGLSLLISAGTIKKDDRDPNSPEFIEEKRLRELEKNRLKTVSADEIRDDGVIGFSSETGDGKATVSREETEGLTQRKSAVKMILAGLADILKLRSTKYLIGASVVYLIANTIFSSDRVFFMTYNLGMSQRAVSGIMLLITVSGIALVPFIERLCRKHDKKNVFMIGIGGAGIVLITMSFTHIEGYSGLIIACLVYSLANTCYWQLMPSMIYDVSEIAEYKSGKSGTGTVVSLQALSESVSIALGLQLLGIILEKSGFDEMADVTVSQSVTALDWVSRSFTLIPGILMVLVFFIMIGYPITKKKIEAILAAKNNK